MKTKLLLIEVGFLLTINFLLPTFSLAQGAWTKKTDFTATTRSGAASFSIGNKGYIINGDNGSSERDFWEWDLSANTWTRKADFPALEGGSLMQTVCFSIGTKGYVFIDYYEPNFATNKFWEYDPETNTWSEKTSLPTTLAITETMGFSIGTKGYIGTGIKSDGWDWSFTEEFWEWDQATNTWTRKADFGGILRSGATGFSIGGKGYIASGYGDGAYTNEFWEWDQATDLWTKKADFPGIPRRSAVGFTIGNKGYVGSGNNPHTSTLYNDFWEWDQATNVWTQKNDFVGMAGYDRIGFSTSNKGYVGLGYAQNTFFLDFWEFDPLETTDSEELSKHNYTVYPNPGNGTFSIISTSLITAIEVYNLLGDRIYVDYSPRQKTPEEIDISNAPKGIYVVKIYTATNSFIRKVVVQ